MLHGHVLDRLLRNALLFLDGLIGGIGIVIRIRRTTIMIVIVIANFRAENVNDAIQRLELVRIDEEIGVDFFVEAAFVEV